ETVNDLFGTLLVGDGLAGGADPVGKPAGVLVGGDWGEGWQYGPLSVFEYALATRAMEENGATLPEMDAWTNSLILRYTYGTVPHLDGHLPGGDFENGDNIYAPPNSGIVGAVLAGSSSEQAAAWAKSMQLAQKLDKASKTPYIGDVLAELRTTAPQSYTMQTPAPPLWYLARGTRTLYVRTGWDQDAFWGAFDSAPQVNSDHHHFDASNFVFTRGGDHLIVDPSAYGCRSTLPTNALTADSPAVKGTYAPSQTPWSKAELAWARGTDGGVYAARGDFAQAFAFSSTPSDIPYAHREWVFLPEGEVVVIDRVHTADAAHTMYVGFHTNTAGTLKIDGSAVTGTVGTSTLAIHPVFLSGATPSIVKPGMDDNCFDGTCSNVRIPVDEYLLKVPGPWAVAVHVLDGLGATEAQATVSSMNDPAYDPGKANGGIVGAAVYRGSKQTYVVAASAMDGKAGDTLSYAVPGASSGRHIVFDAPEDGDGKSQVTATVAGDQCTVSITAGAGFAGHPLMFQVSTAADGCKATEDTDVPSSGPPPGGGVAPIGNGGGSTGSGGNNGNGGVSGGSGSGGGTGAVPGATGGNSLAGGCGCVVSSPSRLPGSLLLVAGLGVLIAARRRRR
ncbi:MAG TPA: MYXO-CTERM sorting domain-containing protein, partial [Polyangia bacterium]